MPIRILLLYLIQKFNASIKKSNEKKKKEFIEKYNKVDFFVKYLDEHKLN
jgi:hypothetical protein